MRNATKLILTAAAAIVLSSAGQRASAAEAPKIGAPAPDFTAKALKGGEVSLSALKGKYVVLEWHNQKCPFVVKHYDTGNMQKLQTDLTADGAVWLSVISSAPGKQGYVTAEEATAYLTERKAVPTDVLFDPEGKLGHLYGAKTTPHMFIIDDKGVLIYAGAIDDKPTTKSADVEGAKNYVRVAYQEAKAGKPVTESATVAYGCSVKYAD